MDIEIENYKGIEFVRVSSLPEDQKDHFCGSFNAQKIIKILRGKELLNDCIRYSDYKDWLQLLAKKANKSDVEAITSFKLVFK